MTPLQKHADFFDRNKDGLIYPSETYQGLRAIGCGIALSTAAAVFINGFLGPLTQPGKLASPLVPIYVSNIHKGIHGSDTGAYDAEGRFVPEKFEAIFEKHARTNQTVLTSEELMDMLEANRIPDDNAGRIASSVEWRMLYHVCKDKDGLLSKEDVRGVYDGSLFYRLENKKASHL
ncbi:unnamed protein product [Spirodela intermedia]|uniref:Uncharacterized protein n=2 Tax=Spirodela intermedia TaxID=51605 RepID=A0A7I8KVN7_SPIIN|nr:unnamed protein product [Spirodela intermedia]CAA6664793.1 unnamed protein product [Spirodela intermedia]CAA7401396.1 unnamed protein product [Spirodela intermedia]